MKLDATQQTVCKLAGLHVESLLTAHLRELEDAALVKSDKTGKAPEVKVSFAVSFNPRSESPRVVTKIRATASMTDEAEDVADAKQMKLSGVSNGAADNAAARG